MEKGVLQGVPSSMSGNIFIQNESVYSAGIDKFCSQENADQCLAFLNRELLSLGLESVFDPHSARFNLVSLLNNVHELIKKQRVNQHIREDFENRNLRTTADLENLELAHGKLKELVEGSEREKAQMRERERQLSLEVKNLTGKLKAEREEVRKLQALMESRSVQYKHNMKKNENEVVKLKDRLRQMLSDKSDKKLGMELTAALEKAGNKRAIWVTSTSHEEDLYQSVLNTHEERSKALMVENEDLRRCLTVVNKELENTLHALGTAPGKVSSELGRQADETYNADVNSDDACYAEIGTGRFQMPYSMIGNELVENLRQKCAQLKQQAAIVCSGPMASADESSSRLDERAYNAELDRLTAQLEKYREIICQQEQLIQQQLDAAAVHSSTNGVSPDLSESAIWEEREKLSREKQLLQEQRARFEQDRRTVTETAIRLGKERRQLDEEREVRLREQFFQMTPFRVANANTATPHLSDSSLRQSKSHHFESTPNSRANKRLLPKSPGFNLNMCELQSSGAVKLTPARPGSASIGASVAVTTAADLARPATVCGNTTGVSSDRERHAKPKREDGAHPVAETQDFQWARSSGLESTALAAPVISSKSLTVARSHDDAKGATGRDRAVQLAGSSSLPDALTHHTSNSRSQHDYNHNWTFLEPYQQPLSATSVACYSEYDYNSASLPAPSVHSIASCD